MNAFELDARLAGDTVLLGHSVAGQLRLMNDARWPWVLLIPERAGVSQLHELEAGDAATVLSTSLAIARAMTAAEPTQRINVGALGNVVAQLHVHHVLRQPSDPAWPGPVWGHGERTPYDDAARDAAVARWSDVLSDLLTSPPGA